MYEASVVRIKTVPIEGAKTIAKGLLPGGTEVVVGKDIEDGALGVFFPEGGQLSEEFLLANNLYRKHPETGESMGGYFDANSRVRAQRFMGIKSNGFWCPLEYLENMGLPTDHLEEGDTFDTIAGKRICMKYETPATEAARRKNKLIYTVDIVLPRHYDTPRLDQGESQLDDNDRVIITEKIHGTSAATGLVPEVYSKNLRRRFLEALGKLIGVKVGNYGYSLESRTRNTYLTLRGDIRRGNADYYRKTIMADVEPYLHQGEVLYYEIAGYDSNGGLIMQSGDTAKLSKEHVRRYGESMDFTYGCDPTIRPQRAFIYRITYVTPDKNQVDLPWHAIVSRCRDLGLQTVPVLWQGLYADVRDNINDLVEGPSSVDPRHIREGVCIRAERGDGIKVFKNKSIDFGILEGYLKEQDTYVDTEEAN